MLLSILVFHHFEEWEGWNAWVSQILEVKFDIIVGDIYFKNISRYISNIL